MAAMKSVAMSGSRKPALYQPDRPSNWRSPAKNRAANRLAFHLSLKASP